MRNELSVQPGWPHYKARSAGARRLKTAPQGSSNWGDSQGGDDMAVLQRTPTRLADGLASADSASADPADSPRRRPTRQISPGRRKTGSPVARPQGDRTFGTFSSLLKCTTSPRKVRSLRIFRTGELLRNLARGLRLRGIGPDEPWDGRRRIGRRPAPIAGPSEQSVLSTVWRCV
jgi:hypothetical protein